MSLSPGGVDDTSVGDGGVAPPAVARRVDVTSAAVDLLRTMTVRHGPVMFHQSGGCCDGSSPMCFPDGDFILSDVDIHLGDLAVPGLDRPVPFWMSVLPVRVLEAHPSDRGRGEGSG